MLISLWQPSSYKKVSKKTEKERKSRLIKSLLLTLAASVLLALFLKLFIVHETDSALPGSFLIMVLPATLSTGLLVLIFLAKFRLRSVAIVGAISSVLFSLLLINNYYRFYPTLNEVFNKNNNVATLGESQKEILLRFTPVTHTQLDAQSVEGSLTSINQQPTQGKVYSVNIPGTVSKFHARTAYVYEPAIYENPSRINLPVIVLTAGFPGLPENWLGSGLQATMNEFAKHHDGITPLVFMVDNSGSLTNDTECTDSPRGNVETYLSVDVPNYIKANFESLPDPSHWAVGGLSMGGMCAVMLALRHPNVYHYFLDYGGEIGPEVGSPQKTIQTLFGGSVKAWNDHQPDVLLANHTYKNMGGFFGVGKQDELSVTQAAAQLSKDSKKAGIETIYEVINGQHTFNVWQDAFRISLPWVSSRIGATECGVACI